MPWILPIFVPGFVDDKPKFELTILLTRICFPYLMCMSLMAAYSAVLNGLGKFTASSFAPILLNVVMIAFMLPLVLWRNTDVQTAIWIAIGTIAGGIAQLWMVYAAIRRAKFIPHFRWPKFDAEVRRFWILAIPAVLTGGITQINIFVGTIIASGAPSAIAYLYYADRLYQLPLGIIGIAIGTVLLPELARHLKGGRDKEADAAQNQSLLISMLLSMPAATALIALAHPIVRVLFQHGAFDAVATDETASTLIWFSAGLPAYVLIRVLQPGFFAREDTLTPTWFAGASAAINIVFSLLLFPHLAHVGIAIATSIAATGQRHIARHLARPARPFLHARGRMDPPRPDHRSLDRHGAGALWPLLRHVAVLFGPRPPRHPAHRARLSLRPRLPAVFSLGARHRRTADGHAAQAAAAGGMTDTAVLAIICLRGL